MVKHWIKSILTAAVAGALMLGTTGCSVGFTLSPDELYRLPNCLLYTSDAADD